MAGYPLEALLSARVYREREAESEVCRKRNAAGEAAGKAEEAHRELAGYRAWRPGEEERLFSELRGIAAPFSAVVRHREDIRELREAEAAKREACADADRKAAAALEELETARSRHRETARARSKIEEHRRHWLLDEEKRREAAEEAELEEFSASFRMYAEDDDGGEEAYHGTDKTL